MAKIFTLSLAVALLPLWTFAMGKAQDKKETVEVESAVKIFYCNDNSL